MIRIAQDCDAPWIMQELEAFAAHYATKENLFGASPEHRATQLHSLIENHLCMVAENEGVLQGLIAGFVVPHLYNPNIKVLSEAFWWVSPEFRKLTVGQELLDAFVNWARDNNINWVTMILEDNSPRIEGFLESRGFKFKEKTFLMELSGDK